ncbi:hypothetical protein ELBI_77 [Anabaena phage Elbi]|nr:hypothetical protein ELBI_77 [Anabaena phage Elbi]
MADNIFSWLFKKVAESDSDHPYTEYQQDNESSTEFQERILREKAENDEHSRKRTNNQLSDTSLKGLEQANIEQAYREGLISKEQYKEKLSEKRQNEWDELSKDWEWRMGNDGTSYKANKSDPPQKRTRKEWVMGDDGYRYQIDVEID